MTKQNLTFASNEDDLKLKTTSKYKKLNISESAHSVWPDWVLEGWSGCQVSTPSVWHDARSLGGGLSDSLGLCVGSSSGYSQHPSLSHMYQPSVGFHRQNSHFGKPAFAFTAYTVWLCLHPQPSVSTHMRLFSEL